MEWMNCLLGEFGVEVSGAGGAVGGGGVPEGAGRERWAALCAANPDYFDAPILAFEGFAVGEDAGLSGGVVRASIDRYWRLAVQPEVETGVRILSVTGVLIGRGEDGVDRVCLGLRSGRTRVYGGLWELAPSGGIEAPGGVELIDLPRRFGGELIGEALRAEADEELGMELDLAEARVIALTEDVGGCSVDVCVAVRVSEMVERGLSWEYDAVRWVRVDEADRFAAEQGCIPPTAAMLRSVDFQRGLGRS